MLVVWPPVGVCDCVNGCGSGGGSWRDMRREPHKKKWLWLWRWRWERERDHLEPIITIKFLSLLLLVAQTCYHHLSRRRRSGAFFFSLSPPTPTRLLLSAYLISKVALLEVVGGWWCRCAWGANGFDCGGISVRAGGFWQNGKCTASLEAPRAIFFHLAKSVPRRDRGNGLLLL